MTRPDADREGSGSRVDFSRSSPQPEALTPQSVTLSASPAEDAGPRLCPECKGAKRLVYGAGNGPSEPCDTCDGTGHAVATPSSSPAGPTPTIRAIQELNAARSARWMAGSPGWTTLEIAGELAGEVGELANICKKLRRSEMGVPGNKVSDEELREQARGEIADVFIVLMLTASKLRIDLEDAVRETFNRKSEQMGFPERIEAGAATATPQWAIELDEAIERGSSRPPVVPPVSEETSSNSRIRGDKP